MAAEGFAAIPNWMIRDQRFSRRAILVYASLASRSGPGGIFPSQKTIATEMGISERTVRSALAELEELGVIERVRRHSGSRGKATRLPDGYVLLPNGKQPEEVAGCNGKQPATMDEATGNQAHATPYIEEEPVEEEPVLRASAFDTFWSIYPRRAGKKEAEKAFVKALKAGTSAEDVLAGARRFRDDPNLPEQRFIPHPSTWLNQGRWEDDPLPIRGGARPTAFEAGLSLVERAAAREQGAIGA